MSMPQRKSGVLETPPMITYSHAQDVHVSA